MIVFEFKLLLFSVWKREFHVEEHTFNAYHFIIFFYFLVFVLPFPPPDDTKMSGEYIRLTLLSVCK